MTSTDSLGTDHRYRLDSRIATGGMGEVWRATDTLLGREVAIKLMKHEYADDPTFRSRFEAEARNAAALHHPGIAAVFDFGAADDRPYLVMELVPGRPLSALLRDREPMPPDTAADLVAQAADGVAAAHAMGIVHRDVKPANLLVTPEGVVKITDFGIARAASGAALTSTGEVIGTPQYLSPEQAEGHPATHASDIYSLGVVAYECLAGRRPFEGDTPIATALAHIREPVPDLPDSVPTQLRNTVSKALAKDPAERFASASAFAAALRGAPVATPAAGAVAGVGGVGGADDPAASTRVLPAGAGIPAGAGVLAGAGILAGSAARGRPAGGARRPALLRRFPAWLPWVAAAVAVLAIVGTAWAVTGGGQRDPSNTGNDNPQQSPSVQRSAPTPSPTVDDRIRVRPAAYVGRPADVVEEELRELGFDVKQERQPGEEGTKAGTVASVVPVGLREPGETLTLFVYEQPGDGEEEGEEEDD